MTEQTTPETFTMDLTGGNGTPFRFVFWPHENDGTVRYYDRRYTLTEGEPGYGLNHTNENGQCCGGARAAIDFIHHGGFGLMGWHEVDAWDVDRLTMIAVGGWLIQLADTYGWDL